MDLTSSIWAAIIGMIISWIFAPITLPLAIITVILGA